MVLECEVYGTAVLFSVIRILQSIQPDEGNVRIVTEFLYQ